MYMHKVVVFFALVTISPVLTICNGNVWLSMKHSAPHQDFWYADIFIYTGQVKMYKKISAFWKSSVSLVLSFSTASRDFA